MRVVILGSGTSTGVPVIGCSCSVCRSKEDRNKRTRSSIALLDENGNWIVVDTTPEFRLQALSAGINNLKYVIYTHLHADHCAGFDDLRAYSFTSQDVINCYLDSENKSEFLERFSYAFKDTGYIGMKPVVNLLEIPYSFFKVGALTIEPIRLPHGNLMTVGLKIGRFVYATDFKTFPSDVMDRVTGNVDIMVASGIHFGSHLAHSVIPETIELFKKIGVKRGILTHLSHEVDYYRDCDKLPEFVEFAYDQMVIDV
ncbi:MAG: MBL fold metallo-hydrolase [Oligoflexales bacterium]|nr:MBL fold metallo-hydrolase [Oligoflexales bacterium]